jgi:hypothetical protein
MASNAPCVINPAVLLVGVPAHTASIRSAGPVKIRRFVGFVMRQLAVTIRRMMKMKTTGTEVVIKARASMIRSK